MQKFRSFIYFVLFPLVALVLQGCSDKAPIGKMDMARIISRIYLADQFIDRHPDMMAQSDSMLVYPAVVADFGYTMEEYNNAILYYMQDGDEYLKLHREAQIILEKRVDEIDLISGGELRMKRWWALDSIEVTVPGELMYDRYLRAAKWLIGVDYNENWSVLDSAFVDIPQYGEWWQNNITPPDREYKTFMVKEIKEPINLNNEKNSSKLRTPDNRRPDKKRLRGVRR